MQSPRFACHDQVGVLESAGRRGGPLPTHHRAFANKAAAIAAHPEPVRASNRSTLLKMSAPTRHIEAQGSAVAPNRLSNQLLPWGTVEAPNNETGFVLADLRARVIYAN